MSRRMILPGLPSAIFSRASEPGHTPCAAPDGRTTAPSGRGAVPVSLSAPRAREKGLLTSGICGPRSSALSGSAALSQSLANRLRQKTVLHGSTLYRLTWKARVTPAGRSIPALRASALRTSGRGSTGWPTPMGNNSTGVGSQKREGGLNLQTAAELSGWPTPQANKNTKNSSNPQKLKENGTQTCLADAAWLAGWPTPCRQDGPHGGADAGNGQTAGRRVSGGLGDAGDSRNDTAAQGWKEQDRPASATGVSDAPLPTDGFWRDADWLLCRDGRWRPVEPGAFPLAHGAAGRVGRLRGYGNAIVAPQAEAFIRAFDELTEEQRWMRQSCWNGFPNKG